MPMRSTSSLASAASRMPAVSMMLIGMPSIWMVSVTRSRVVPAMAVTMAKAAHAAGRRFQATHASTTMPKANGIVAATKPT